MNEGTEMIWSEFLKTKNQSSQRAFDDIVKMQGWRININAMKIKCDNTLENKTLEENTGKAGIGCQIEYTPRGTPQQNEKN